MHASTKRLYMAAERIKRVTGQSNVARLLNESPQTVKNWESRGVSDAGAVKAEGIIGCRAYWLATGEGDMLATGQAPVTQAPPTVTQALPVLLDALAAVPPARWVSVRAQLDLVAQHPEMRDDVLAELHSLLQAGPAKRQAGP